MSSQFEETVNALFTVDNKVSVKAPPVITEPEKKILLAAHHEAVHKARVYAERSILEELIIRVGRLAEKDKVQISLSSDWFGVVEELLTKLTKQEEQ